MPNTQINQGNYNAFQSYMLLQIPENFDVIAKDDIFYTVLEIVEGVNLSNFINFNKQRSDGYDKLALFTALLLSLAIHGKLISLRDLERECREKVQVRMNEYHVPDTVIKTRNEHCKDCPLKTECTKSKYGRTVEIDVTLEGQKKKVRNLLLSEQGIEIMKNRSIQSEGAFGILKEDYGFDCLSRRGETGVKIEVYCASIGFNIRKYHKAKLKKLDEEKKATNNSDDKKPSQLS